MLAGLAAWLPQDLVDAAAAAAAAGTDSTAAEDSGEKGPDEGGGAAAAAAAAGAVGVSGVSLWREEARVAGSIVEIVTELEERWGGVLDKLEQAQVRGRC